MMEMLPCRKHILASEGFWFQEKSFICTSYRNAYVPNLLHVECFRLDSVKTCLRQPDIVYIHITDINAAMGFGDFCLIRGSAFHSVKIQL